VAVNERVTSPNEVSGLLGISPHTQAGGGNAGQRKKRTPKKPPAIAEPEPTDVPAVPKSPDDEHSIDCLA
jgi:hypothetical protein